MITVSTTHGYGANRQVLECVGLTTDAPYPTDTIEELAITNGSTLLLMDTQEVKFFDEENRQWL